MSNSNKNMRRIEGRRLALGSLGAISMAGLVLPFRALGREDLAVDVPTPLRLQRVVVADSRWRERSCLAVELTDEEQGRSRVRRGGNESNLAIVHENFSSGTIEVDVAAQLNGKGPPESRGFVGVAFHVNSTAGTYECVYLRMTNGRLNAPPPPAPRGERAIQYIAHPDFHFDVSREKFPGQYEKGADIALGQWHRLRLEIAGRKVQASVDGRPALQVDDLRFADQPGAVGLWVDDGTRAYFSRVKISSA